MGSFQKILKPTKYRAVDTSSNNNHGQIYSGRALEFDGVSDYINAGSASSLDDIWINGATIAAWIYCEDASPSADMEIFYKGAGTGPSQGWSFHVQTNGTLRFNCDTTGTNDGNFITSEVLQDKTWYRVVVTYNLGSSVSSMSGEAASIYINGIKATLGTSQALDANYDTDAARDLAMGAGATNHDERFFAGMMSDAQVWDSEWTQSDVTYDYLNPESLALNNGGTSLTESNLKLWYPMQDGHRGQQSYIMDGANTGLGDEVLGDPEFNTDVAVNTAGTYWTTGTVSDSGWSISGGKAIQDGSTDGGADNFFKTSSTVFVTGVTYKITLDVTSTTAGALFDVNDINGTVYSNVEAGTTTFYFTAGGNRAIGIDAGSGKVFDINSISIKAVNDKHHATTVFYGDELIATQANREFGSGGQWVGYGSPTSAEISGAKFQVVTTGDSSAEGAYLPVANLTAPVAGKTYRIRAKLHDVGTANADATYKFFFGGTGALISATDTDGPSTGVITTTEQEYYADVVAANTTGNLEIRIVAAANDAATTFTIDNVSVKEVGTATGWTDADQQLDIPQTALQSYNQLAWFDGATDYATIADNANLSFVGGSLSISAWIYVNTKEDFKIMTKGIYNAGTYEWNLRLDSNGKLGMIIPDESVASCYLGRLYNTALTEGEWHHVVGTWDGGTASSGIKLYLNGERVDDTDNENNAGSFVDTEDLGTEVTIGKYSSHYSEGCITECSLWKDELSQAEVNELYNDGKALDATTHSLFSTKCVGYYRNNGLASWTNLATVADSGATTTAAASATIYSSDTLLLPAGVDASRDNQGFLMNRQKDTNSLNFSDSNGAQDVSVANEYVEIPRDSSTNDIWAGGGSISCWIKPSSDGENNGGRIFQKGTYIQAASESGGKLKLTMQVPFSSTNGIWTSNENNSGRVINIGEWNHIVITYNSDATSNDPIYYINNATEGHSEQTPVGSVTTDNTTNAIIGNSSSQGIRQFDGQIDDMLIYSDILSADEVDRIYKAGTRSHR